MKSSSRNSGVGRQYARAGADVYVNKIIGDEPHLVRMRDISTGGVFVYKLIEPERAPQRGVVGLEIKLPGSEEIIWATGRVVREQVLNGVEGVAIRFLHIADADRRLIAAYVARQTGLTAAA